MICFLSGSVFNKFLLSYYLILSLGVSFIQQNYNNKSLFSDNLTTNFLNYFIFVVCEEDSVFRNISPHLMSCCD